MHDDWKYYICYSCNAFGQAEDPFATHNHTMFYGEIRSIDPDVHIVGFEDITEFLEQLQFAKQCGYGLGKDPMLTPAATAADEREFPAFVPPPPLYLD